MTRRTLAVLALLVAVAGCGNSGAVTAEPPPAAVAVAEPAALTVANVDTYDTAGLRAAAQRFYDALHAGDTDTLRGFFPDGGCDLTRDLITEAAAGGGYPAGARFIVREVQIDSGYGFIAALDMEAEGHPTGPTDPQYAYSFAWIGDRWWWNCDDESF